MEKVKSLLVEYWELFRHHRPHLALAVIGGAKKFRLERRKKETFKVGCLDIILTYIPNNINKFY